MPVSKRRAANTELSNSSLTDRSGGLPPLQNVSDMATLPGHHGGAVRLMGGGPSLGSVEVGASGDSLGDWIESALVRDEDEEEGAGVGAVSVSAGGMGAHVGAMVRPHAVPRAPAPGSLPPLGFEFAAPMPFSMGGGLVGGGLQPQHYYPYPSAGGVGSFYAGGQQQAQYFHPQIPAVSLFPGVGMVGKQGAFGPHSRSPLPLPPQPQPQPPLANRHNRQLGETPTVSAKTTKAVGPNLPPPKKPDKRYNNISVRTRSRSQGSLQRTYTSHTTPATTNTTTPTAAPLAYPPPPPPPHAFIGGPPPAYYHHDARGSGAPAPGPMPMSVPSGSQALASAQQQRVHRSPGSEQRPSSEMVSVGWAGWISFSVQ